MVRVRTLSVPRLRFGLPAGAVANLNRQALAAWDSWGASAPAAGSEPGHGGTIVARDEQLWKITAEIGLLPAGGGW